MEPYLALTKALYKVSSPHCQSANFLPPLCWVPWCALRPVTAPPSRPCAAKDLVTVQKTSGGALQIASTVTQVTSISECRLFPRDSPHNFCYLSIDPLARHVKCWYAAWFPM